MMMMTWEGWEERPFDLKKAVQGVTDEVVSMYKAGISVASIAEKFGYTHDEVRKILEEAEVKLEG